MSEQNVEIAIAAAGCAETVHCVSRAYDHKQ
jgi:hypothetical protein